MCSKIAANEGLEDILLLLLEAVGRMQDTHKGPVYNSLAPPDGSDLRMIRFRYTSNLRIGGIDMGDRRIDRPCVIVSCLETAEPETAYKGH